MFWARPARGTLLVSEGIALVFLQAVDESGESFVMGQAHLRQALLEVKVGGGFGVQGPSGGVGRLLQIQALLTGENQNKVGGAAFPDLFV
ncbi:hypothetical protein [Streptomyces vinaceus]|uniref:hypothetical protein n=1 Tax=Streptomyces vinaceus TaxID=1960 RepID=UPI003680B8DB